jgi:hypothetical protein
MLMNRLVLLLAAASLLLGSLVASRRNMVLAQEKSSSQLEAEIGREANPNKRARLAIDLMNEMLKQLRSAYETEDPEKETAAMESYLAVVDRVAKAVKENTSIGTYKYAEIQLRQHAKALESLKASLALRERPPVEKAAERVSKLHEEILYSTINVRKKEAKQ